MEELMQKLTGMLNSPEGMNEIKNLAGALLGNNEGTEKKESNSTSLALPDVSPAEISVIMKVMSALKSNASDDTCNLLYALKPHLKGERQEKIDKAVKLIKIYRLLPLIKEGGFF